MKKYIDKTSVIALVLLLLVAGGVGYYEYQNGAWQTNVKNATDSIFTVASSTGTNYFTVTTAGNVGIGTDDPQATLEVAGTLRLTAKSTEGCSGGTEGMIAYNPDNKHFWGCDGSQWHVLDN